MLFFSYQHLFDIAPAVWNEHDNTVKKKQERDMEETNIQTADTPWQNKHIELHKEAPSSHILHTHELSAATSLRGGERLIVARLWFGRFHHKITLCQFCASSVPLWLCFVRDFRTPCSWTGNRNANVLTWSAKCFEVVNYMLKKRKERKATHKRGEKKNALVCLI